MSNKPLNGKADQQKGGSAAGSGEESIAQGLQSVMAVIGETYDPAAEVLSGAEAPGSKEAVAGMPAVSASPKLTDKIDAARHRQEGDSSVTQGLQSIMAVIGETYDETDDQKNEAQSTMAAPAQTTAAEQGPEVDDALSDLMPLLTEEEKGIGASHGGPLPSSGHDAALLGHLQDDITGLAQTAGGVTAGGVTAGVGVAAALPAVVEAAPGDVRSLLSQLQGDISALRQENDALKSRYNIPLQGGQGGEVANLLAQLQGDISSLRSENDALKSKYGIATSADGGGGEIANLLAQLQGDITGLRTENEAFKAYYNVDSGRSKGTSFGQALLMTLGVLTLVGGATLGGFYLANRMNDQKQEDLLSMLGLQQQRLDEVAAKTREVATKTEEFRKEAAKPEVKVAALPKAKPKPLPKITVNKPKLDSAEVRSLIADAQNLIELGDLVSARQMLEYAMSQKSAEAAFKLAQTYDPLFLAGVASVLSVEPSLTRAKVLYYSAARQGHQAASKRLAELRETPAN